MTASSQDIPDDVLSQAIDWTVKLHSDTATAPEIRQQIERWRAANPVHDAAWRELTAAQSSFQSLPVQSAVLAGHTFDGVTRRRATQRGRRKTLHILGFGGLAIGVGAIVAKQVPTRLLGADYATGTGDRRTVDLADGTQIKLNSNTAVDVRYTAERRLIVMHHGDVFIHTGKDNGAAGGRRPFWVYTPQARLEAIGTQFYVRQVNHETQVAVTEGQVAIDTSQGRIVVHAGQAYAISSDKTVLPVATSGAGQDITAWADGVIVAKQMRLGDFVEELSRYRRGWLRCAPDVADLKVSGVFQIDQTDHALEALTNALPIDVEHRTRYWVTLVARKNNE